MRVQRQELLIQARVPAALQAAHHRRPHAKRQRQEAAVRAARRLLPLVQHPQVELPARRQHPQADRQQAAHPHARSPGALRVLRLPRLRRNSPLTAADPRQERNPHQAPEAGGQAPITQKPNSTKQLHIPPDRHLNISDALRSCFVKRQLLFDVWKTRKIAPYLNVSLVTSITFDVSLSETK